MNYAGRVWGVRAAVPALIEAGGGALVIIASVAGLRGGADEAVYAGTKAEIGLAGAPDRELRPKHVRVSAGCPAAVDMEFAIGKGSTAGEPWLREVLRPEDVARRSSQSLSTPRTCGLRTG